MGLIGGMFHVVGGVTKATYNASMRSANSLSDSIQRARTKKEIQAIYKNVLEANYANRCVMVVPGINKNQLLLEGPNAEDSDVYDYSPCGATPAEDYIWGDNPLPEGEIVSGGENDNRAKALIPFIHKAQQEGIPVVVLHNNNNELNNVIMHHSVECEYISKSDSYLDIFRGMPVDDIAFLLYELMCQENVEAACESLLRAVLEVVLCINGTVSIELLAKFPIRTLKTKIDDLLSSGDISKEEYEDINRYYMAGASQLDNVRIFLNKLNRQTETLFGKQGGNNSNIKRTINVKGVESINLGAVNNDMVVNLVINYLLMLQSYGKDFAVLIDGFQISKFPLIMDLLRGNIYAISSQDFIASLKGKDRNSEELFSELLGNVNNVVLFKHLSGDSRKKWSEFMGTYKKIRVNYSIAQNNAYMNYSDSKGISLDEADEPRIRPETLEKLSGQMVCIYNPEGILIAEI